MGYLQLVNMQKTTVVDKKGLEYIPNIDRMIREKECRELTTLANSTDWRMEKEGKFPKKIKVGSEHLHIGFLKSRFGYVANGF